ncbi:PDDEXK nuclease domain-containing protein [Sphingomonas abietis]|uniref:PDDEXK nuclease domain-containing protein n=1 Tax=Sphingomonas abietis TaxID=3012344 RepID=A0ABY7NHA9_9SPHN|nr:PDDEXK nuclease domain-containing protein [Sphingomonas abietis]WBO20921.1 PDDEXK nuclease domain-containing protein [Sphingomonas abietis]
MTTPVPFPDGDGYASLLAELKERIRAARLKAAVAVNQELIMLYWSIGRDILGRQSAEGWGARVIQRLADDLRRDFPEMTGLSARNLNYMRALSAVDDQLRHEADAPSIGIILCKGKNEVVVEYALRDSVKPMGVAEYRVSAALPETLQAELPTVAEFARDFPLISLVQLRIEIERELRSMVDGVDTSERPLTIAASLQQLDRQGLAPPSTRRFHTSLQALNRAAHGLDIAEEAAVEAEAIASTFLAELRAIQAGDRR